MMKPESQPLKALNTVLWVVQVLLATTLIWAASMKLLQPIEKLSTMWPWTGQIPLVLVKLTGILDLLGALGLILPALLRVKPKLTPIAAVCIGLLMICALIFHVSRGEASVIGVNICVAILAAFIAWGRFMKVPIHTKE